MSTASTTSLWKIFKENTSQYASKPAIRTSLAELSFNELFNLADHLAYSLAKVGVKEGRLVSLILPNSVAFVPTLLALMKLSCVVALASPKYKVNEFQSIVENISPHCYITIASVAVTLQSVLPRSKNKVLSVPGSQDNLEIVFADPAAQEPLQEIDEIDNLAIIKLTSGSTGIPKGIGVTTENLLAEAKNIVTTLEIKPSDSILSPVPIFHSYGFDVGVLPMLYTGALLILHDIFVPRRILTDLADKNVSIFLGVPSNYRFLIDARTDQVPQLSHVRYLLSCTAPLPTNLISSFHQKYHMSICQHYGSSETGAVTTHIPAEVLKKPESVGKAMHNVDVRIIDDAGGTLPVGEEGEIVVRSDVVSRGYVMGIPNEQSGFFNNEFRTGDLGVLDNDGFLYVKGRKDQIINVGGMKVSPHEVIQVLTDFPAVSEAAVVGVRDSIGEEVVYAVVTLRSETTETEILSFCRNRLADYKIPRRIEIRTEMPRGASGKIVLQAKDLKL